jgi:hypothetical protein
MMMLSSLSLVRIMCLGVKKRPGFNGTVTWRKWFPTACLATSGWRDAVFSSHTTVQVQQGTGAARYLCPCDKSNQLE